MRILCTLLIALQLLHQSIGTDFDSELTEIVILPDGSTSLAPHRRLSELDCGAFTSKVLYPSSKSFGVEINCPPDAIARCIAWIKYPSMGNMVDKSILQNKVNFWSYENHQMVTQSELVVAPIIVKDGISEGRSCRRVIFFQDLPTNMNPEWDVLCSYTGTLKDTAVCTSFSNEIFIDIPH